MTVDCTIINAGSKSDFMGMCNSQQRTICPHYPHVESAVQLDFDEIKIASKIGYDLTREQNR